MNAELVGKALGVTLVAAVAGPELESRVKGYADGTIEFDKETVLRDLSAAVNLAKAATSLLADVAEELV